MEGYRVTLGNLESIPRSMNSGLGFFLLLRGGLQLETADTAHTLREGDIAVLNHAEIYSAHSEHANVTLWVQLPFEVLDAACPGVCNRRFACVSAGAESAAEPLYASIKHHVAQVAYAYYTKEAGFELLLASHLYRALYELVRDFSEERPDGQNPRETDGGRMASILAYIHQNYKSRIGLEEVAAREFLSVQYLSKLFRQKMGSTFSEYLAALRLASAVEDLVHTDDSVTRIALDNGFASVKALNLHIQRTYGVTPQAYRKQHAGKARASHAQTQMLTQSQNSLDALVRFIDNYERSATGTAHAVHEIALPADAPRRRAWFARIANIGQLANSLRADTRSQLAFAKRELGLDYVYFSGFLACLAPRSGHDALFQTYDFHEAFNVFSGLGLVPFVQLDAETLLAGGQSCLDGLVGLLCSLRQGHRPEFFAKWQFELVGTPDQVAAVFPATCAAISSVYSTLRTGVRVEVESAEKAELFDAMLRGMLDTPPDFVTLALDPNHRPAPADAAAYEALHAHYHLNMVKQLEERLRACGMQGLPIYLTEWNTLTGKSTVEAGEFHRTALVADVLASLSGHVAGFGVELSLFSQGSSSDIITHPLSLYVYRNIRRPMFFVYRAFASLKQQVLLQKENVLLTSDGNGRYAVLLYNPCYINPFHSLDNIRREVSEKVVRLTIKNLAPGKYRIKQFLMDKDNGSLYHSWVKLDFSIPLDEEDIDEYLENVSNPSVLLFEAEVEGSYTIQQPLSMNATALYVIKRIG